MVLAGVLFATVAPDQAISQDQAASKRGEAVVEQWCRLCHQRAGDRPDPDMAPPFEELVGRPGRDRAFYLSFMAADHFPMPIFRLFENEKSDVVEYLLSLQPE